MGDLLEKISELIDASAGDVDQIEHTLTDGYAHAMTLEAERWRIERRIAEIAARIQYGDLATNARELSALVTRLDGNAGDLQRLRRRLAELRRVAESARVSAPEPAPPAAR